MASSKRSMSLQSGWDDEAPSQKKLYLVARVGPAIFGVMDDSDGMFRVKLGNPHTCPCDVVDGEELCPHIFFCLNKVKRDSAALALTALAPIADFLSYYWLIGAAGAL
jgi:hypothetical protein